MPNWCDNFVEFSHADPAQIQRLHAAYKRSQLFGEFKPCPPELMAHTAPQMDEALGQQLMEKYSARDWYDWCVSNWGTKWDINDAWADAEDPDPDSTMVGISFMTAWAPPIEFYRTMTDLGFTVEAHYLEEGVGFVGKYSSETDDDCYEFEDSLDLKNIPEDIRNHWDLDSIMADREQDYADIEDDHNMDDVGDSVEGTESEHG